MKSCPLNSKSLICKTFNLLVAVLLIGSCTDKQEFVTIAYGYSENPRIEKVAFEINPNGNCYYVTVSEDEISAYYSSKIPIQLAEVIINFARIRIDSTDSLSSLQDRDATIAEYLVSRDNEVSGGYRYLTQGMDGDSIDFFVNSIRESSEFKSIPSHKFSTTIQNQTLPTPPPLPIE
jgi:hypothetical protein